MSFSALAKAAIENGQQDHVKYIVAAAMEYPWDTLLVCGPCKQEWLDKEVSK